MVAAANAGLDIASQMLLEGRSFECIHWGSVAFSALPLGKLAKWAKPLSLGQEIGILRDAAKYKGNFGLGSANSKDAIRLGKDWVGKGFKTASDGKTMVSNDGLRQFRPPSYKGRLGKTQANFQSRNKPSGEWQTNGHLDIN